MLRNPGFTPRDWNQAPQYDSPGNTPGVTVLDFAELTRLAREEQASGAFRATDDGTLAKAPLFVDDLPAAFYMVDAHYPDFTPNHNTSERETLVVMRGAIRLVYNHGLGREDPASQAGLVAAGDVMELSDEPVSMQSVAVSLTQRSVAWALALYRDFDDGGLRPDFQIVR
jgi:hypothetical protein